MKVRELLVAIKFAPDTASIAQTEQTITSMKNKMAGMGTAAVGVGGQIDTSIGDSLNRVVELLEISNEQFYALAQGLAEGFNDVFGSVDVAATKSSQQMDSIASKSQMASKNVENLGNKGKEAGQKTKDAMQHASREVTEMYMRALVGNNVFSQLAAQAQMFGYRVAAFAGIGFSTQRFIAMADQWKVVTGQIKNVVKTEQEALDVREKLYEMASRTRQGYQQAAGLFTSVSRSAKELGKSTTEILDFTENVAKAMLIGGGSAESQQAALIQLGQALGSGTLRGDELNSILEQAPVLAKTIADGMGITIGQLRQYGREGKLTAQALFEAVQKQADNLNKQLGNTPWTVRQAMGLIQNSMLKLFGTIEEKTGIVSKLAQMLSKIAVFVDKITENGDDMIQMFKVAAGAAAAFYLINNAQPIIAWLKTIGYYLGVVELGYKSATSAEAIWNVVAINGAKARAGALIASMAHLLPIIALLTGIVLICEDFYQWTQGNKSIFGELFGDFEPIFNVVQTRWAAWKGDFAAAMRDMRGLVDWLKNGFDLFCGAIKRVGEFLIAYIKLPFMGLYELAKKFLGMFGLDLDAAFNSINGVATDSVKGILSDSDAIRNKTQVNSKNLSNIGNMTAYITVNGADGDTGKVIAHDMLDYYRNSPEYDELPTEDS